MPMRVPKDWVGRTYPYPPEIARRFKAKAESDPYFERKLWLESAAAHLLWIEAPDGLCDLLRPAALGESRAQAQVAAVMKIVREKWPEIQKWIDDAA